MNIMMHYPYSKANYDSARAPWKPIFIHIECDRSITRKAAAFVLDASRYCGTLLHDCATTVLDLVLSHWRMCFLLKSEKKKGTAKVKFLKVEPHNRNQRPGVVILTDNKKFFKLLNMSQLKFEFSRFISR